jgi:hypothetical protein
MLDGIIEQAMGSARPLRPGESEVAASLAHGARGLQATLPVVISPLAVGPFV